MEVVIIIAIIWGLIKSMFTPGGFFLVLIFGSFFILMIRWNKIKAYFQRRSEEKVEEQRRKKIADDRNKIWTSQMNRIYKYKNEVRAYRQFEKAKNRVKKGYNLAVLLENCTLSDSKQLTKTLLAYSSSLCGDSTTGDIYVQNIPQPPFSKGASFFIGEYLQNTEGEKTPLEWFVADTTGSSALLISKYAIEYKRYSDEYGNSDWSKCTLRKWLNGDFYSTAFSMQEKQIISYHKIITEQKKSSARSYYYSSHDENKTNPPIETMDRVFILSDEEFGQLPTSAKVLIDTIHCQKKNPYKYSHSKADKVWLRNNVADSSSVYYVNDQMKIATQMNTNDTTVVRPAIVVTFTGD